MGCMLGQFGCSAGLLLTIQRLIYGFEVILGNITPWFCHPVAMFFWLFVYFYVEQSKHHSIMLQTPSKRRASQSSLCSSCFLPNQWFSICGLWAMVCVKAISEGSVKGFIFQEISTSFWLQQYLGKYWNLFWRCQGAGPSLCSSPPSVCILLSSWISFSPDLWISFWLCLFNSRALCWDLLWWGGLHPAALRCLVGQWLLLRFSLYPHHISHYQEGN